jgi:hypothetical protein
MVPLCSCITGLGSEQPLLLDLLYSIVPTKKKTKRKGTLTFYPPQEVDRQIYCVIMYFSCYVMLKSRTAELLNLSCDRVLYQSAL